MKNKLLMILVVVVVVVAALGIFGVQQQKQKVTNFEEGINNYESQITQEGVESTNTIQEDDETAYYFEEVVRDVSIENIVSVSRIIIPESFDVTTEDLSEEMQAHILFGYELEDVALACYYAARTTYGSDVLFEYSELVAGISYTGYYNRVFMVNGKPMQFVFNDTEVYIKEYLQQ